LSTAEPTVHGTPPVLGSKTVSIKTVPKPVHGYHNPQSSMGKVTLESEILDMYLGARQQPQAQAACAGAAMAASVPPPPPRARPAVTQVEGGGGFLGAVSFVVETPADIKSNGQMKKLTVGVLQLSVEVTHYIVPAKAP
ncbi:unnamed protein product, partial [Ectocarpus sp. 8 AP-2014]